MARTSAQGSASSASHRAPAAPRLTAAVAVAATLAGALLVGSPLVTTADVGSAPTGLRANALRLTNSLKTLPVPDPVNFPQFVKDRQALRRLGKALFWDQQVGSDGQACASCHFHAGADNRSRNQLNPGFRNQGAAFPGGDKIFGNSPLAPASTPPFGPNYRLTRDDFPLHRLADPKDARSALLSDTNDVVSSQGVFNVDFLATGMPNDVGAPRTDGVFKVGEALVRNVEPRNTPSTINAALNHRNFWDARARNEFNGVSPIGSLDPGAVVIRAGSPPQLTAASLLDSSAASQANGPPLSELEMSFAGRNFAQLGRKLLSPSLEPLAAQLVATDDSLLGPFSSQQLVPGARGTSLRYADLVRQAIQPAWWDAPGWKVDLGSGQPVLVETAAEGPNLFSIMEYNFSLFFGLAVSEYEKTLISDDSPFDRWLEGDGSALGPRELAGLQIFLGQGTAPGQGRCIKCHLGPALTGVAFTNISSQRRPGNVERMVTGNFTIGVYDTGHYNIGVRPTDEDLGIGADIGPHSLPLADVQRLQDCVKQAVKNLTGSDPGLDLEVAIREANVICKVPPIGSRPNEAARVATHAAELASAIPVDVGDVAALLADATVLLTGEEPLTLNFSRGTGLVRQALDLFAAKPGLTAEVLGFIAVANRLMPDPLAPPPGAEAAIPTGPPLRPEERIVKNGAFKTPGLRNVELTAPYFHNGGQATLEQVVEFYDRGGDFREQNLADVDADIGLLSLTVQQKSDLVAFLKSLTDERVKFDRAPFDHPSLEVANGGSPGNLSLKLVSVGVLDDRIELPAVGAAGSPIALGTPGTPFANFPDPLWAAAAVASGDQQSGHVGAALGSPLVVLVLDDEGKPVPGVPVSFAAPAGASVTPASAVTGADGTASTAATLGPLEGSQTFFASAPVSGGARLTFVAQAAAPAAEPAGGPPALAATVTAPGPRSGGCGTAPGAGIPALVLLLGTLPLRRRRRGGQERA